jgi:O-antigen ligase
MEDNQQSRYGIKYGISGSTFYLVSSGLLGTFSFFFFYLFFGVKAYKYIKHIEDPMYIAIAFGMILSIVIFIFDFFFYSTVFFTGYIPSLLFFYFAAILFKQINCIEPDSHTLV